MLRRTTTSSGTTMTAYVFGLEEHSYFNTGGHKSDLYYYTLGGRLLGALDNSGKTTFYLTDALGSVLASFSSAAGIAAIKGNQVFGPYGNARDFQGTINTAKGYTGQYNDSLTGLDYYGSRYYDQVAGVFLSADTVQGNMQGIDPYAYVGGNPETFNDPTGHDPDPGLFLQFVKDNPWILVPMAMALSPAGVGAWLLVGTSIGIALSPNRSQGPAPTNSPQPTGAPTPDETPTATPTPSTDTNGAMCRSGGCYNLVGDEGRTLYTYPNGKVSVGHTIARHVNVSAAYVRTMADRTKEQGGNGRYSAFYSLEDAEWAVQYALDHLGNALEKIAPDSLPIGFTVDTGQAIGYGYQSGNPNRVDSITRITVVVVIGTNSQVSVTTAYPTLDRYQPPPPSGNVNRLIELNEM